MPDPNLALVDPLLQKEVHHTGPLGKSMFRLFLCSGLGFAMLLGLVFCLHDRHGQHLPAQEPAINMAWKSMQPARAPQVAQSTNVWQPKQLPRVSWDSSWGQSTHAGFSHLHNLNPHSTLRRNPRPLTIVSGDLGGQYGDSFHDVDNLLVNYFTYRALKEMLAQLQEIDLSPMKAEYKWLYNFAGENPPNDGSKFVRALFAAGRADYAQRIVEQRKALMNDWIKEFVNQGGEGAGVAMNNLNLELLREHLCSAMELTTAKECTRNGRG